MRIRGNELSENPLTEEELKKLRDLLTADGRRQWLVSGIRSTSIWVAGLGGGYFAFKSLMEELFK